MTIEELRAHQKKTAKLTEEAMEKPSREKDTRFWEPTIKDKDTKISSALIRPISCVADEDQNVVVVTSHFIKKNGKNYSFVCPKTVKGNKCPICEEYWSKPFGQRDTMLKPKKKWLMNIYVIDDRGNPENNGKVFLWAAPKTIWDKIESAKNADYAEDKVENIFDMWDGASILIRTKDKAGFLNYEDSMIRSSEALFKDLSDTDPKYLEVAQKAYPLNEFSNPKDLKSYEELSRLIGEVNIMVDTNANTNPGNYVKSKNLEEVSEEEMAAKLDSIAATAEEDTSDEDFFKELDLD